MWRVVRKAVVGVGTLFVVGVFCMLCCAAGGVGCGVGAKMGMLSQGRFERT